MEASLCRAATIGEVDEIMSLYSSLIGTDGCTWNEYYPSDDFVREDAEGSRLFCYTESGEIIAAVGYEEYDDLFELDIWHGQKPAALVRLGVKREHQGRGIGKRLVEYLHGILKNDHDSVRLLVAERNTAAIKLYNSLGYTVCGETDMYGNHYICMEYVFTV